MLCSIILFGLRLGPLFSAIAQVESERGATSDNVYQIRSIYVNDVNRVLGVRMYHARDVYDVDKSEMMMFRYWKHYGEIYASKTGMLPTYEVLARMHNGGPDGWKKQSTVTYWLRVKSVMENQNK